MGDLIQAYQALGHQGRGPKCEVECGPGQTYSLGSGANSRGQYQRIQREVRVAVVPARTEEVIAQPHGIKALLVGKLCLFQYIVCPPVRVELQTDLQRGLLRFP